MITRASNDDQVRKGLEKINGHNVILSDFDRFTFLFLVFLIVVENNAIGQISGKLLIVKTNFMSRNVLKKVCKTSEKM